MRLHTNGSSVVLLSPSSRIHWRPKGRVQSEPLPAESGISDFERNGMLCLTPSGERDFSARLTAAGAVDGAAINEDDVAAVIMDDERAYLVRGPVSIDGDWKSVIDLSALEPLRVEWPNKLIWAKSHDSLYEMYEEHGPGIPDTFMPAVECNAHGVAVCSTGSGVVAVVRPDSRQVDFSFVLPSQEEAAIFAQPTDKGVLVTLIIEGEDSAILHIAENGTVLGKREAVGCPPALLLDDGILIYDRKSGELQLLDLAMRTKAKLAVEHELVDSASAPDGASFAFASTTHIITGHVNVNGELEVVNEYGYASDASTAKRASELAAAQVGWDPERAEGPPAVGFAAGVSPAPWVAEANSTFELTLVARSTGGEGQGISIILGGDAVKHVSFESVSFGDETVEFIKAEDGSYQADMPGVPLLRGLQYPFNPKPKNDPQKHAAQLMLEDTHLQLVVTGKATKSSSDLLSVCISALGSNSQPLKWMRPLQVS